MKMDVRASASRAAAATVATSAPSRAARLAARMPKWIPNDACRESMTSMGTETPIARRSAATRWVVLTVPLRAEETWIETIPSAPSLSRRRYTRSKLSGGGCDVVGRVWALARRSKKARASISTLSRNVSSPKLTESGTTATPSSSAHGPRSAVLSVTMRIVLIACYAFSCRAHDIRMNVRPLRLGCESGACTAYQIGGNGGMMAAMLRGEIERCLYRRHNIRRWSYRHCQLAGGGVSSGRSNTPL